MISSGCVTFDRITYDRINDTTDTLRQVEAYDKSRDAVCGVGK